MLKKLLFLILLLVSIDFSAQNTIKLLSWNIKDFGQSKDQEELMQIANIVKDADIVAIQEVVAGYGGAQAVAKLSDLLNRKGATWDYVISDPTTSPPYMTERYAFIWKTKHIKIKNRGHLLKALDTEIDREPLWLDFDINKKKFSVLNFHSRPYKKNPIPEITALNRYVLDAVTTPLLIAGDFNTNQSHDVFSSLKNGGFTSAIVDQKTTLKRTCTNSGSYRNYAIDTIFYSKDITKISSMVIDFVKVCDQLETARKLSDHLPVVLEFQL